MIRSITVTNPQGESLTMQLTRPDLSGFIVKPIDGLGPVDATINFSEFGSGDGAMYNSSRVGTRNIVLSLGFMEKPTIEATRHLSYKYFPNKKNVYLVIETDERTVATYGYVEKNTPDIFSSSEGCQISIVCPSANLVALSNQITNPIPAIMVPNPTLTTDLSGYECGAGPGGTSVGTRETTGSYSGKAFYRNTITVRATATGPSTSCPIAPVTPGVTYTFSGYYRGLSSLMTGKVLFYRDGIKVGTPVHAGAATVDGSWSRRTVTFTAPPNVDSARLSFVFGGIGAYRPAVGATFDVDAVQYEVGAVATPYSEWYGDSSAIRRNLWSFSTIAAELAIWNTVAGPGGAATLTSVANGGVQNGSFIRATWSAAPSGGTISAHTAPGVYQTPLPCAYGESYRLSAWVRPSANMTVYAECGFFDASGAATGGYVNLPAPVVCQGDVWTRVSITVTPPAGATTMRMYYANIGDAIQMYEGANIMDIDQVMCERGTVDGSYFENVNLTVNYVGEVDTGFIFRIKAVGAATNVTITKLLSSGEFTKIDTTTWLRILGVDTWSLFHDLDMVTVTSITGSKSMILDRSFYGLVVNMINSVTRDSSWLKLTPGVNVFEIKADTGLDSLRFSVENPIVYEGV